MFCPRCGSPNPDTTKFCRQCGLGLQQVTGYVASGGTAPLPQPQSGSPNPIAQMTEGLAPKQKMILGIMALVMSPAIFGTMGLGQLSGISAVLMPIGIVFIVMWYKAQQRKLQQMVMTQQIQAPMYTQMPPVAHYNAMPPVQQPIAQTTPQPVYQSVAPQPTNPLKPPASVTEDETRRFQ